MALLLKIDKFAWMKITFSFVPHVLGWTNNFVFEKFRNIEYYRVKQHWSRKMPGFELVSAK